MGHDDDNGHEDEDVVDFENPDHSISLLIEFVRFEVLGHDHVHNHGVGGCLSLEDRVRDEVLHVAESVILVLHVVVDLDVVGEGRRVKLLQRDARLHLRVLVVEEEFQLVFVSRIVLRDSEAVAETWLVLVPSVALLGDIIVDGLFRFECAEAETSKHVNDVFKVKVWSLCLQDCLAKELLDHNVRSLIQIEWLKYLRCIFRLSFFDWIRPCYVSDRIKEALELLEEVVKLDHQLLHEGLICEEGLELCHHILRDLATVVDVANNGGAVLF